MSPSNKRSSLTIRFGLICCLWLVGGAALAQDRFSELSSQARIAYEAGAYAEGLAALQAAYAIRPEPRILLKQGHLHLHLKQPEQALLCYRRYQDRSAPLTPAEQAELDQYRERAQALLAGKPHLAVPGGGADSRGLLVPSPPPNQTGERRWLKPLGWSLGGIALAGGAAGAVLLALDGRRSCPTAPLCEEELSTRGAGIAVVSLAGATLLTSIIVITMAHRKKLAR